MTDALNEMPNLRDFTNTVSSFTSDHYSSLGAVCVDVPGWSKINSTRGFEYGGRLLAYVYETLADIFGSGVLFRTWDAEFVGAQPEYHPAGVLRPVCAAGDAAAPPLSAGGAHRAHLVGRRV